MKHRIIHIFVACIAVCILAGCSCNETKVIPRGKMAQIYAEMLVVDQWLLEHTKYRMQADTSLVYEPIFQKYGYTTEDYRISVDYYMNDPERYSRILRTTVEILEGQVNELKAIKSVEDRLNSIVPYKMNPDRLYFGRSRDRLWAYGDSVSVALDSVTPVYELGFHELSDTLFDGLNIITNVDTLSVKDTIPVKESVSVEEPAPAEKATPAEKEAPVEKSRPAEKTTKSIEPIPMTEVAPVKETASKSVNSAPVKPAQVRVKGPQRLLSTTLDSLKRK